MTWNELFYLCLQKPVWIILGLLVFAGLVIVYSVLGQLRDLLDIAVLLIWAVGIVYLPAGLPVSMIYATLMRRKYRASGT